MSLIYFLWFSGFALLFETGLFLMLLLEECHLELDILLTVLCLPILSPCKGKLSDMKSAWSPGPISQSQASLSHELWKVPQGPRSTTAPSRPPPGLTNTKPSSTWGGNSLGLAQGWSGSYTSGEHSLLNHIRNIPAETTSVRSLCFSRRFNQPKISTVKILTEILYMGNCFKMSV